MIVYTYISNFSFWTFTISDCMIISSLDKDMSLLEVYNMSFEKILIMQFDNSLHIDRLCNQVYEGFYYSLSNYVDEQSKIDGKLAELKYKVGDISEYGGGRNKVQFMFSF